MPSIPKLWSSLLLCFMVAPHFATAITRFRSWFPRYEFALNYIVDNNCSVQYNAWNTETSLPPGMPNIVRDIWQIDSYAGPLDQCILDATPEYVKSGYGSAAVLLGLMPTILAALGPSIQETSTLLALGDHPLLALCLCLGSPLIGLERTPNLRENLNRFKANTRTTFGLRRKALLTCFEYLIAFAAIANIAEITWELAIKVSFTFFQGDATELAIWGFVGFMVHIFGALALSTRVSTASDVDMSVASSLPTTLRWLRWRVSFARQEGPTRVTVYPPTIVYFLLVAFTTILTACQLIFGTIIFSGVLFISIKDAVGVFFRYMASVIACRLVVLIELAIVPDQLVIVDGIRPYQQVNSNEVIK